MKKPIESKQAFLKDAEIKTNKQQPNFEIMSEQSHIHKETLKKLSENVTTYSKMTTDHDTPCIIKDSPSGLTALLEKESDNCRIGIIDFIRALATSDAYHIAFISEMFPYANFQTSEDLKKLIEDSYEKALDEHKKRVIRGLNGPKPKEIGVYESSDFIRLDWTTSVSSTEIELYIFLGQNGELKNTKLNINQPIENYSDQSRVINSAIESGLFKNGVQRKIVLADDHNFSEIVVNGENRVDLLLTIAKNPKLQKEAQNKALLAKEYLNSNTAQADILKSIDYEETTPNNEWIHIHAENIGRITFDANGNATLLPYTMYMNRFDQYSDQKCGFGGQFGEIPINDFRLSEELCERIKNIKANQMRQRIESTPNNETIIINDLLTGLESTIIERTNYLAKEKITTDFVESWGKWMEEKYIPKLKKEKEYILKNLVASIERNFFGI